MTYIPVLKLMKYQKLQSFYLFKHKHSIKYDEVAWQPKNMSKSWTGSPEMKFKEMVFGFEWSPRVDLLVSVRGGHRVFSVVSVVAGWGWTSLSVFFCFTATEN